MELRQAGHFWEIVNNGQVLERVSGSRRFAQRILEGIEARIIQPVVTEKPVVTKKKATKKKVTKKKVAKKKA